MLTARGLSADKLEGFAIGADDYIVKPFDTPELLARIRGVLRRAREMRAQSPLTGLPGNVRIEEEIDGAGRPRRGRSRCCTRTSTTSRRTTTTTGSCAGDQAIQATARLIEDVAREVTGGDAFIGHVGGDDFVRDRPAGRRRDAAEAIVDALRREVPALYDTDDRERGYSRSRTVAASSAVPCDLDLDRRRDHREARVRALRGGRRDRDRDEVVHEGDARARRGRSTAARPDRLQRSGSPGRSPARRAPRVHERLQLPRVSMPSATIVIPISSPNDTSADVSARLRGRRRCPG